MSLDMSHRIHFHSLLHGLVERAAGMHADSGSEQKLGVPVRIIAMTGGTESRHDGLTLREIAAIQRFQRRWLVRHRRG